MGLRYADGAISHDQARSLIVNLVRDHFKCSRVSYWSIDGSTPQRVAECIVTCGVPSAIDVRGSQLRELGLAPYLKALSQRSIYVSADAAGDPSLSPFADAADAGAARSLMHAACSVNGRLIGVLCCEQVGETRKWSRQEAMRSVRLATGLSMYIARVTAQPEAAEGPVS